VAAPGRDLPSPQAEAVPDSEALRLDLQHAAQRFQRLVVGLHARTEVQRVLPASQPVVECEVHGFSRER
jgi:hypothetical protein